MNQSPILEELHQIRAEFAARFNYDINAMVEYLRARQTQEGHPVLSFAQPPNAPAEPAVTDAEPERRAA